MKPQPTQTEPHPANSERGLDSAELRNLLAPSAVPVDERPVPHPEPTPRGINLYDRQLLECILSPGHNYGAADLLQKLGIGFDLTLNAHLPGEVFAPDQPGLKAWGSRDIVRWIVHYRIPMQPNPLTLQCAIQERDRIARLTEASPEQLRQNEARDKYRRLCGHPSTIDVLKILTLMETDGRKPSQVLQMLGETDW